MNAQFSLFLQERGVLEGFHNASSADQLRYVQIFEQHNFVKSNEDDIQLQLEKVKRDLEEQVLKAEKTTKEHGERMDAMKSDYLASQAVDWRDKLAVCLSTCGGIAGVGCMSVRDEPDTVFYGGLASAIFGVITGLLSLFSIYKKVASTAKVHNA